MRIINYIAISLLIILLAFFTATYNWVKFFVFWYGLMALSAYFLYWKDKRAAVTKMRRVPENTLHLFALLGGWPGAMIAQQQFRHKTQKVKFKRIFWLTVIVNYCALYLVVYPGFLLKYIL